MWQNRHRLISIRDLRKKKKKNWVSPRRFHRKKSEIYLPFSSCSRHSKVISNSYLSVNLAGLLRILTPRRETTDMFMVGIEGDQRGVYNL